MGRQTAPEETRQLEILEALEEDPEARQADLAARLGMAVGTVNWVLKRMAAKGYLKIKRIGQWHWRYLLTPQGMAQKARLTQLYLKESLRLYREIRSQARILLHEAKNQGFDQLKLDGDHGSELLDICRLTCLEVGLKVVSETANNNYSSLPVLKVQGRELSICWPPNTLLARDPE